MNILSRIFNKLMRRKSKSGLDLKTLKYVFEDECAFCNDRIDYSHHVVIEDKRTPCCLYCKALVENGTRWHSILKKNYPNEKRRYCNKYLRIVMWFSDFD